MQQNWYFANVLTVFSESKLLLENLLTLYEEMNTSIHYQLSGR